MTDEYFAAYKSGNRIAIAQMIDFYGGPGTWASWPQRVRDYAIETTPVNSLLDWEERVRLRPNLRRCSQASSVPTLVLMGANSHAAVQARQPASGPSASPKRDRDEDSRRGPFHDLDACARSCRRHRAASGRRGTRRQAISSCPGARRPPESREWRCPGHGCSGGPAMTALINVVRGVLCGALLFAAGAAQRAGPPASRRAARGRVPGWRPAPSRSSCSTRRRAAAGRSRCRSSRT